MKSINKKGFTLTEILIALTVFSMMMAGFFVFFKDVYVIAFVSDEKLNINRDVRHFTLSLSDDVRASNQFYIYRSFQAKDRDGLSLDASGDLTAGNGDQMKSDESGDFLYLVYTDFNQTASPPVTRITKIVGYFRRPKANADGTFPTETAQPQGPVYRFEKEYATPVNLSGNTVESLLSEFSYEGNYKRVVELSEGLANARLFYNYFNRSVMVKAQLIHGNDAKQVTDTYNYTVSPRG